MILATAGEPATVECTDLAKRINAEHAACERSVRTGVTHAINAGRMLLDAKRQVGHGGWLPWLKSNIVFSERTAQGYMRCARHAGRLTTNPQRVAEMPLREALLALATPADDPVEVLNRATNRLGAATEAARPRLDRLRERLARQDVSAMEAGEIATEAGNIQNDLAELRLRGERAAGRVLMDVDVMMPPPDGYAAHAESGQYQCWIVPAVQQGFYHVAVLFTDNPDGSGGAFVEGTKKPWNGQRLRFFIDGTIFAGQVDVAAWTAVEWPEPIDHNPWLYTSHQQYVDQVILGKAVTA